MLSATFKMHAVTGIFKKTKPNQTDQQKEDYGGQKRQTQEAFTPETKLANSFQLAWHERWMID